MNPTLKKVLVFVFLAPGKILLLWSYLSPKNTQDYLHGLRRHDLTLQIFYSAGCWFVIAVLFIFSGSENPKVTQNASFSQPISPASNQINLTTSSSTHAQAGSSNVRFGNSNSNLASKASTVVMPTHCDDKDVIQEVKNQITSLPALIDYNSSTDNFLPNNLGGGKFVCGVLIQPVNSKNELVGGRQSFYYAVSREPNSLIVRRVSP